MRIRTGFSFRTAVGQPQDVLERIKHIGWSVAPLSDRCSTFGYVPWTKAAEKLGLRPIYGVELGVVPSLGDKKPIIDYWTFFAIDDIRAVHDLIYKATSNPGREPTLLYKDACAAKGVIKIAGERAQLQHIGRVPKNFFISLSPSLSKILYKTAKERKFKFIAMSDNFFPREEDKEFYRVALGRRAFTQTYPQWILNDREWDEATWQIDEKSKNEAIVNRGKVFAICKAKLRKASLFKPDKPLSLRQMCEKAAPNLGVDLKNKVYSQRLTHELEIIGQKNFEDYFYIIADMINWAKQRMIVGPARGSSCGSLVCYLLGITSVDPIPFGLIFERFIDVTRVDLPDIDIDFSDTNRQLVFDYAEEKYGADHVARLGTVGTYQPRSALKMAVGPALKIPTWQIEKLLDGLIERSSGDSRALQTLEDTLTNTDAGKALLQDFPEIRIAQKMEGHPANAGQHAAGVVITQDPVMDYVAVDRRTGATMCGKYDAEYLNLLKIDALGLTQLSIFERTLQLIGKDPINGFLETIPLDDQMAFEVLNRGNFAGIFQFTGAALQSLTKQIKVTHIEDMISITALARPGPLATGGANDWVKRKNGLEAPDTIHPMLTELTKDTYGIVIYQETVMNIVRHMGKMSWEDTSAIRKAMSGRLGDEFFRGYWEKFLKGSLENGINEIIAKQIWDQINTFGSWAFNRSHAVAYGLVSYWCCWLKAHHPIEFAAATLDAEVDPAKQITLLRELDREGIDYVSFDPDRSTDRWLPIQKDNKYMLLGPLTSIKGFGPAAVSEILEARASGAELRPTISKRLSLAKTDIDSLSPISDAIKRLYPDLSAINILSTPTPIKEVQCGIHGKVLILAVAKAIRPRDDNDAQKVTQRGGKKVFGRNGTMALNMFFRDDTDEIFCKVHRDNYERLGKEILERGREGKALYAIRGWVPEYFRMVWVEKVKFLGFMDDD